MRNGERNRRSRAHRSFAAGLIAFLLTGACTRAGRPLDDREKIVRSVLTLLVSDGKPACLDARTRENSLAIFREMMLAPHPSRAALRWYPPRSLRPFETEDVARLRLSSLDETPRALAEPGQRIEPLPGLVQFELWRDARRLAGRGRRDAESVRIRHAMTPPLATARWWPLNRIRKDCVPNYRMSDPVYDRNVAFVTLRAEHSGTLYVLRPAAGAWTVVAEWSRWLY